MGYRMQTCIKVSNFSKTVDGLKGLNMDIEKAVSRTIADCKARAPAQVTKAVTTVYGIRSSEVTAAGKAAKRGAKTVGRLHVAGVTVNSVKLEYMGRPLTPVHFSMTPKRRPEAGKAYRIKVTILKGRKRALGSHVFLAPSGAAGTTEIPFRRTSEKRGPIKAIHTVSIPQMIENETATADIQARMEELLTARLRHNTERLTKP